MSQVWSETGEVVPVTLISAGPCIVTQVKTKERDGYEAYQLGYGEASRKQPKAQLGHTKDLGSFRTFKEFRVAPHAGVERGTVIDVSTFAPGDIVHVTGTVKGRGFQGVVKRHGFGGSPATHGHKDQLRMPGAISAGGVQHVQKGRRMGGHMGTNTVTVRNLKVVMVDLKNNLIAVKGAIPGARGSMVEITVA